MLTIEKELDKAFQRLSIGKRCFNCKKPSTEIHHREPRENKIYRWNKENALPICRKCHNGIHFEGLKFPKLEIEIIELKDYLLREGLIFDEFLKKKALEYNLHLPTITTKRTKKLAKRKNDQSEYKKKVQKKSQELWRKRQKELYQKKKQYLKSLKKK